MSNVRIVKKYPNRRLYDTAISSYITLDDVKRLVLESVGFQVVDARSGDDITRTILLQIISEQEEQGNPIFSTELLAHIIRSYGDSMQGLVGRFLEQSLRGFVEQAGQVRERLGGTSQVGKGVNPLTIMSDMAEQNLRIWKTMQESLYQKTPAESVGDETGPARSRTTK